MKDINQSLVNVSGNDMVKPSTVVQFTVDRILTILACSVFIPCIIAGNLLVITAVVKTRQLRTVTNVFVVSLAVTDAAVGATSLPIYLAFLIKGHVWFVLNQPYMQHVWKGVDIITGVTSIINLMNISIDRYICIHYPFRYSNMMSSRKSAFLVAFSWFYGFFCFSLSFIRGLDATGRTLMLTIISFLIPLFIIIVAYISIARVAGRQAKKIKGLGKNTRNYTVTSFLKEVKAARVLAVVVCAFVLCWTGTFILNLKYVICKNCSSCECSVSGKIINAVKMLQYFGSVVNPFIYTSLNKDFRKAIKRLVPGSARRNSGATISNQTSMRYTVQDLGSSEEAKLHTTE